MYQEFLCEWVACFAFLYISNGSNKVSLSVEQLQGTLDISNVYTIYKKCKKGWEVELTIFSRFVDQSTPHGLQSSILHSNQPMGAQGRKTEHHMIRHKDILPQVVQDIQWNSAFLAVRDPVLPYVLQSEAAYEILTKQSSASLGSIWPSFWESCKITVILVKCLLIKCCQTRHGVVN